MVARLWPMRYTVASPAYPPRPLWRGTVTLERLRTVRGGITFAETAPDFTTPVRQLAEAMPASRSLLQDGSANRLILLAW